LKTEQEKGKRVHFRVKAQSSSWATSTWQKEGLSLCRKEMNSRRGVRRTKGKSRRGEGTVVEYGF